MTILRKSVNNRNRMACPRIPIPPQMLQKCLMEAHNIMRGTDRISNQRLYPHRMEVSISNTHSFRMNGCEYKGALPVKLLTQKVVGASSALAKEIVEDSTLATLRIISMDI